MAEAPDPNVLDDELSVSIIIIGKCGSGKTSLASAIVGENATDRFQESKSGWKRGTQKKEIVSIQADKVTINVTDTCALMDTSEVVENDETVQLVSTNIAKNSDCVIIVCIDMYDRIDESTMTALAHLHMKHGDHFWTRVVIALTKADRYDEHKWLELKDKRLEFDSSFLTKKFKEEEEECKLMLKEYFTVPEDKIKSGCFFGMTANEFESLNYTIIPTSRNSEGAKEKMKRVGCGFWLDLLIGICCKKVQSGRLIQIHKDRCQSLPNQTLIAIGLRPLNTSNLGYILDIIIAFIRRIRHLYIFTEPRESLPRFEMVEQDPADE